MLFSISLSMGCACSQPCTMEELVGTYVLTNYKRVLEPEKEGEEKTEDDYFKNKNIEMYLVITGNERGYLSYKDDETNLIVRETFIEYNYKTDDDGNLTNLISTIKYLTCVGTTYDKPQDGWSSIGTTGKGKNLNNNNPKYEGFFKKLLYRDYIDFKKVSNDTDLSYITKTYSSLPQIEPYNND